MINEIFYMSLCVLALILLLPVSALISKILVKLFKMSEKLFMMFGGKNGK